MVDYFPQDHVWHPCSFMSAYVGPRPCQEPSFSQTHLRSGSDLNKTDIVLLDTGSCGSQFRELKKGYWSNTLCI